MFDTGNGIDTGSGPILIGVSNASGLEAGGYLTAETVKKLKAGVEPNLALKMAKDKMRRDGWEHPFYWSAFVIC